MIVNTKTLKLTVSILIIFLLPMCQSPKTKVAKDGGEAKLIGVWGLSTDGNANFRIQADSIYYPEHFKSYKYHTKNDTLYIHYDGWTYRGAFLVRNDTLILRTQAKENRFVHIKSSVSY